MVASLEVEGWYLFLSFCGTGRVETAAGIAGTLDVVRSSGVKVLMEVGLLSAPLFVPVPPEEEFMSGPGSKG